LGNATSVFSCIEIIELNGGHVQNGYTVFSGQFTNGRSIPILQFGIQINTIERGSLLECL
jgi:hypothetical protein